MTSEQIAGLVALLRESKREHYHCDDSWYCCGACTHPDHCDMGVCSHEGESARVQGVCNCGADTWNARVDVALPPDQEITS